jgi:hypothetical protein
MTMSGTTLIASPLLSLLSTFPQPLILKQTSSLQLAKLKLEQPKLKQPKPIQPRRIQTFCTTTS